MQFLKTLLSENAAGGSVSAGGGDIAGVRMPLGAVQKTKKKRIKNIIYRKIVEDVSKPEFDSTEVMSKIRSAEKNTKQTKDTVTFGLEDDLGNVIKVLVPKEEAKDFELALAAALEDSETEKKTEEIAAVLFDLQSKFNIVDVEWPAVEEDEEEEAEMTSLNPDEMATDAGTGEPIAGDASVDDTASAKSALDKVIDMMKADADARMAEANAKKAEADAKAAEFAAKTAESKMKAEEEILDMEDFYSRQGEEDKEAKRLAKLAKYRHDLAQQAEDTLGSEEVAVGAVKVSTESVEEMKTVSSKDKKKAPKKKMTYQEYLSMARKHVQSQE